MNNKEFYGSDKPTCLTYMEFGEIDQVAVKKNIWGFQLHQKAYDWFMLARYSNDILAIRKMQKLIKEGKINECKKLFRDEIHHKDELCLAFGKLAALYATGKTSKLSFFELGQTLFGCIDAMEFAQMLLAPNYQQKLQNMNWLGVDISEMFNELAKIFYNEYKIDTALTKKELPNKWDVFYSKGITLLYVVRELKEFYEYINSSDCAYFDYSFSLNGNQDTTIGSGKTVRYLNLKDFLNTYSSNIKDKKVYVNTKTSKIIPEKNQIWIEFFIGKEKSVERFLEFENNVYHSLGQFRGSDVFVDDYHKSWVKLEDFLKTVDILL